MGSFTEAKQQFDDSLGKSATLAQGLVPVDGKQQTLIPIRRSAGIDWIARRAGYAQHVRHLKCTHLRST